MIQNVKSDEGANSKAFVKSSVELTHQKILRLSLRVDKNFSIDSGVVIRVDSEPLGTISFFKCDNMYCVASVDLSSSSDLTEAGVQLELGATLYVDVRLNQSQAVRLPISLRQLREGIAALLFISGKKNFYTDYPSDAKFEGSARLIGPQGIFSIEKLGFMVSALDHDEIHSLGDKSGIAVEQFRLMREYMKSEPSSSVQLDSGLGINRGLGKQEIGQPGEQALTPTSEAKHDTHKVNCEINSPAGQQRAKLMAMVSFDENLKISNADSSKIVELVRNADKCESDPYFYISSQSLDGSKWFDSSGNIAAGELVGSLRKAGVSPNKVLFADPGQQR